MDKRMILIVEENPKKLELIAKGLKDRFCYKFIILRACTGKQAIEILKVCKIDIIVADVEMRCLSFFRLMKKIKIAGYNLKTILIGGKSNIYTKKLYKDLCVTAKVPGPYSVDDLAKVLMTD